MIPCPRCPEEVRSDVALELHLRVHDLRDKFAPVTETRPVSSQDRRDDEEGE